MRQGHCCCCPVTQWNPTLCDSTDCRMPGSLSLTIISWSLPKFMSIASVMPSNHLILCYRPSKLLEWDFSDSPVGKESAYAGDPGWIPGSGRPAGERIGYPLQYSLASLMAQPVKNPLQCRRPGFNPWVVKIPWKRKRLPTPIFWPGEFQACIALVFLSILIKKKYLKKMKESN